MGKLANANKYMVIKAKPNSTDGVNMYGQEMKFGKSGAMTVSDKGKAEEINSVLGYDGTGEVMVVPHHGAGRDSIHKTHFTMPEMPWKKEKKQ